MPSNPDPLLASIEERLTQALSIHELVVVDDSAAHRHHPESPGHAASHLNVRIISPDFEHKTPIERHRLIYAALGDLMGTVIHALRIEAKTPAEWDVRK